MGVAPAWAAELLIRFETDPGFQVTVLWRSGRLDDYPRALKAKCTKGLLMAGRLLLKNGDRVRLEDENVSWCRGWGRLRGQALAAAYALQ